MGKFTIENIGRMTVQQLISDITDIADIVKTGSIAIKGLNCSTTSPVLCIVHLTNLK